MMLTHHSSGHGLQSNALLLSDSSDKPHIPLGSVKEATSLCSYSPLYLFLYVAHSDIVIVVLPLWLLPRVSEPSRKAHSVGESLSPLYFLKQLEPYH